jgi:two-component system chemotaxis response regulator CheB
MTKIKVLVLDHSITIRNQLMEIINRQPDMEVVATSPDPLAASELIRKLNPDVLTLDVEAAKLNGLDFLEKLLRLQPISVVMISSLSEHGSDVTFRALELGAVDFLAKPRWEISHSLLEYQEYSENITDKIRAAARAKIHASATVARPDTMTTPRLSADAVLPSLANPIASTMKLIILGASTGGTEAIKEFLTKLPPDCPGILITQHMPEAFTLSFANRLDSLCKISVKEARNGDRILPGHAYIAPGHSHLLLKRSGTHYVCELNQGPPVNRHRPSVDVLFRSAANCAGKNAIGVILTGMGKDGAIGMLEMKRAGAYNFAQDEASCVVFGMPKEAIAAGGVHEVVPLREMASRVMKHLANQGTRAIRE